MGQERVPGTPCVRRPLISTASGTMDLSPACGGQSRGHRPMPSGQAGPEGAVREHDDRRR